MADAARLEIRRPKARWRDRARKYTIEVDSQQVETIKPNSCVTVLISPGKHTVRAAIAWTGSEELTIEAVTGDVVRLEVRPAGGAFTAATQAVSSDEYLSLTRLP